VVLYANVMSRVEGHKDQDLLQKKGGRGFPHLVFMDAEGAVVQQIGSWRDVEGFAQTAWALDAVAGAESADAAMAKLVLEKANLADTRAALSTATLTEAQQARWALLEAHFEVAEVLQQVQKRTLSAGDAGAKFVPWIGTPKEPKAGQDRMVFWQLVMAHADAQKDAVLFERCMGVLRELFVKAYGDHPQLGKMFEQWDQKLAQLKAGGGQ
jgi:hypothetical protein